MTEQSDLDLHCLSKIISADDKRTTFVVIGTLKV